MAENGIPTCCAAKAKGHAASYCPKAPQWVVFIGTAIEQILCYRQHSFPDLSVGQAIPISIGITLGQ